MKNHKLLSSQICNILDGVGDMIIVHSIVSGFIYFNNTTLDQLGYTYDEFSLLSISDIVHRDYIDLVNDRIINGQAGLNELILCRKNGSICLVESNTRWMQLESEKILVTSFRDIGQRKQAEEDLQISEERYRLIIENQGEGIGIVDLNETFVFCNPAAEQIFGVAPGDLVRRNLTEFVIPSQFEILNDETDKRSRGTKSSYEIEIINAKKETLNLLVTATPQFNKTGEHTGTFGVFRDITNRKIIENELKVAKEKAEELSKLKSSLLLNISHELRTPMNGILGFSTLLRDELHDLELKNMADIIYRSGNRLMTTLNSIMQLAQVEADQTQLVLESLDIGELTLKIIESNNDVFETKDIKFFEKITKGYSVLIDKKLYSNVVFHIIDNAIKFTKEGQIKVTLFKETTNNEDFAILKVSDTGIGISPLQLTYIFDAFRQGTEGVGRKHEGTGLGLTLCNKFVNLMGGTIEVESTVGVGTTFSIRFRISEEPGEKLAEPIININKTFLINGNKPRVLIVEDNKFNAELITIYLGSNFITSLAYSGKEAISLSNMLHFDIILMDINLGQEMDGINAVSKIREAPGYINTPIIAITGYSSPDERKFILNHGLTDLLTKPFDKNSLIAIINKAIINLLDE